MTRTCAVVGLLCAWVVVSGMVAIAEAGCPIGAYEWIDAWRNRICKSFDGGSTRSIEGP